MNSAVFRDFIGKKIRILYTNYRGVTEWRCVTPLSFRTGKNEYHKEEQDLMFGYCYTRNENREFSIKDIKKYEDISS